MIPGHSRVREVIAYALDLTVELGMKLKPALCLPVLSALVGLSIACSTERVRIYQIQGAAHTSPLAGNEVRGVRGIVTVLATAQPRTGFWIQDPEGDADDATSEGLFVAWNGPVEPGQEVEVDGRVKEHADEQRGGDLTVTTLEATEVRIVSSGRPLPPPVRLGASGRRPPSAIDDDGLTVFEPSSDAIDFYESLEGMRVEIGDAVVVGATTRHGDIAVVADHGTGVEPRTRRGGVLLRENGNPECLLLSSRLLGSSPQLEVGSLFEGPVKGVVDYDYSNFKVLPDAWPTTKPVEVTRDVTDLRPTENQVTVATLNVFNLSADDEASKFEQLAEVIVNHLASPDVVALQEVQDANGPDDDGLVDASATFAALLAAVGAAGGPTYDFRQIDPEDGADGGQPGANIRVGLLFNPARVDFVDRGQAGPRDEVTVEAGPRGARLSHSPGRVSPMDPAFEESRKPLAAELAFRGRSFFVIVTHLNSKSDDDPLMGQRQPPRRPTETQRAEQVKALRQLMDTLLDVDETARVVVIGDMNELPHRAPMQSLTATRWVNLIEQVAAEDRYTFNFLGTSQVLDHVVVSPALAERSAPEIDVVHVHADFAHAHRGSDHDPVVARLTLE